MHIKIGIVGISGYGKSVLTGKLLRQFDRVIAFDPTGDEMFDDENMTEVYTNKQLDFHLKNAYESKYLIVLRPEIFQEYYYMIQTAAQAADCALIFDELAVFAPSNPRTSPIAIDGEYTNALYDIFLRGRKRGQSIIWNSQRGYSVNMTCRSQTHTYCVFRTIEERDLIAYGVPRPEFERVKRLKVGEFYSNNPEKINRLLQ